MLILQQVEYVERFHLLFLAQLGHNLDKSCYALKGGCNLRFFSRVFAIRKIWILMFRTSR